MVGQRRGHRSRHLARTAALYALLLMGPSCGIFSPRDSEAPQVSGRTDPFNFKAIMNGTGQTFTKLRYEDLFVENALAYYDFNSGWYSKSQLMQRLQQIQVQDTLIEVQWNAGQVWTNAGNDTMILSGLRYYIFPDGNTGGTPADSGSSNFTMVYKGDWLINQWTDVPASPDKSFFAP